MPFASTLLTSDDRILDDIRLAFRNSGYHELQQVELEIKDGDVHLTGVLPTHYCRQVAQLSVMRVPGVATVNNAIKVA